MGAGTKLGAPLAGVPQIGRLAHQAPVSWHIMPSVLATAEKVVCDAEKTALEGSGKGSRLIGSGRDDALVDFAAVHRNALRRVYPDPDLSPFDLHHRHLDVIANHQRFADSPRQNEHVFLLRASGESDCGTRWETILRRVGVTPGNLRCAWRIHALSLYTLGAEGAHPWPEVRQELAALLREAQWVLARRADVDARVPGQSAAVHNVALAPIESGRTFDRPTSTRGREAATASPTRCAAKACGGRGRTTAPKPAAGRCSR